jgi:hypothetical protein
MRVRFSLAQGVFVGIAVAGLNFVVICLALYWLSTINGPGLLFILDPIEPCEQ